MSDFYAHPMDGLSKEQCERAERAHQNRLNARNSTGPRTPEGKAAAAQNARKHGFAAAVVTLKNEDKELYELHLDSYFNRFEPADQVENDVVRRAANSMWKYDRLTTVETTLLEWEMIQQAPTADAAIQDLEPRHIMTAAFKAQCGERSLELCRRYLSGLQRDFDRAISLFKKLKDDRPGNFINAAPPETVSQPVKPTSPPKPGLEIVRSPNEASPKPEKPRQRPRKTR